MPGIAALRRSHVSRAEGLKQVSNGTFRCPAVQFGAGALRVP